MFRNFFRKPRPQATEYAGGTFWEFAPIGTSARYATVCVVPFSFILRRAKAGYKFKSQEQKINHQLYMDDLKLYGKNEAQIDFLAKTVQLFSNDIAIEFGTKKCGVFL